MTEKTYRVIQWMTGEVGQGGIRHFADNPVFDLVGVLVHSPEKVGKDAGEIADIPPIGLATDDVESIVANTLGGVDTLTAVGLCAEIGDFERFARAEQLMSYVGLVPSEHSSGQTRRQGSITKSGSPAVQDLVMLVGFPRVNGLRRNNIIPGHHHDQ